MTDRDFRRHLWTYLTPPLTRLTVAEARCIAAGVQTFPGALLVLVRYANRRGASHLSANDLRDFEDTLAERLLVAISEAEAAGWGQWLERNHISLPPPEEDLPGPWAQEPGFYDDGEDEQLFGETA